VLDESGRDRARLTMVWVAALAAAVAGGRKDRAATPSGLAAAGIGLVVAAGLASRLSSARTEGRDAVRVIGRPALAVPGWVPMRAAPAVWTTDVLTWGPTYEPHRAPLGVVIGDRLRLPPGDYAVAIRGERVPSELPPPILIGGAGPGPAAFPTRLSPSPEGLGGVLRTTEKETTLRLEGGGPFIIKDIRLERHSTISASGGLIH
jgi:hypothetical protein